MTWWVDSWTADPTLGRSRQGPRPDLEATPLADLRSFVDRATASDVERALATPRRGLVEFAALISPAAAARLEDLAQAAHQLTVQRFGRTVRLFAPLYLSNECVSTCTYCGFSRTNRIARRSLSVEEALAEARELTGRGFRRLLLVAASTRTWCPTTTW